MEDDPLDEAYRAIVADARADIAAGREPDEAALTARVERLQGDPAREQRALQQLARVLAVGRARARVERPSEAPAPTAPRIAVARGPRRALIKTRPTITGNMDVRRGGSDDAPQLVWERSPGVTDWELRISERPDPRRDYVVRETVELPGDATTAPLPLGEHPVRVHLLGRSRGRLLRRAILSGLSRETWRDKWERRASAS